jgi:PucR C-terminal helix-turn-helix domain
MTTPPLSDEVLKATVALYFKHGQNQHKTAETAGLSRNALQNRLKRAAERGLYPTDPVMPGFRISRTSHTFDGDGNLKSESIQQKPELGPEFVMPPSQVIKGVSALVDPDGRIIQQWIKTRTDEFAVDWAETFKAAFAEFEGRAEPIAPPLYPKSEFLNLIPCNDWHVNLLTWRNEVGESWDLKIAERVIGNAIESAIMRARSTGTAIVLGGGDLMHNDDNTNRTARGGNLLDADGRHQKGIEVAQRLKVRTIDLALKYNDQVIVRILKGNHDEQSSVAIAHFLAAWYRNEPRVVVDLDASLFWYYQFGRVMLAATHGHTVKLSEMPMIMAHRRAEMWGATKFRYAHGFHVHHKSKIATEGDGVICESHQAPIPQDGWHFGSGYLSGRSVRVITYHKALGEFGGVREPILDAGDMEKLAA